MHGIVHIHETNSIFFAVHSRSIEVSLWLDITVRLET